MTGSRKSVSRMRSGMMFVALALAMAIGCKGPVTPSISLDHKGALKLVIAADEPRTLLPTFVDDIHEFLISFDGPESVDSITIEGSTIQHTVNGLAVGSWIINVIARNVDGLTLASSGDIGVTISANASVTVNVTLEATQKEYGEAQISFDWTESGLSLINDIVATLTPAGGEPVSIDFVLDGMTATWISGELASGSYDLLLVFSHVDSDLSEEYGIWDSAMHIYDRLVTKDSIILEASNFDSLPVAPGALTFTEFYGQVRLDWSDNSIIETGYIVEQSSSQDGTFSITGVQLAENITAVLLAQDEGSIWYYRVRAVNQIGQSGPSNVVMAKWDRPAVVAILSPSNGAQNVPIDSDFVIQFSESLDPDSPAWMQIRFIYPSGSIYSYYNFGDTPNAVIRFSTTIHENDTVSFDPNVNFIDPNPESAGNIEIRYVLDAAGNEMLNHLDTGYQFTVADVTAPSFPGGSIIAGGSGTTTTIPLSWNKASDNRTPQSSLLYQVYHSTSDNLGNLANCLANGTLTAETTDISSHTITGLLPGTEYWFNIVVIDAAGNKRAYTSGSATTVAVGSAEFSISVTDPSDETFTFSESDDIMVLKGSTLSVNLVEEFESYSWRVDGMEIAVTKDVEVQTAGLSYGVHRLTVYALKAGKYYSRSIRFTVIN